MSTEIETLRVTTPDNRQTTPGRAIYDRFRFEMALEDVVMRATVDYANATRVMADAEMRRFMSLTAAGEPVPFEPGQMSLAWDAAIEKAIEAGFERLITVLPSRLGGIMRGLYSVGQFVSLLDDTMSEWLYRQVLDMFGKAHAEGLHIRRVEQALDQVFSVTALDPNEQPTGLQTRAQRLARTAATSAYNRAMLEQLRADGYTLKLWVAHHDNRTRDTHAHADGVAIPLDNPFRVGDGFLRYPGDPEGPIGETINCRCVLVGENGEPTRGIDWSQPVIPLSDRLAQGLITIQEAQDQGFLTPAQAARLLEEGVTASGAFGYNPNQARAPKGTPIGGQWIYTPGGLLNRIRAQETQGSLDLDLDVVGDDGQTANERHYLPNRPGPDFVYPVQEYVFKNPAARQFVSSEVRLYMSEQAAKGVTVAMYPQAFAGVVERGYIRNAHEAWGMGDRNPFYMITRDEYELDYMGVPRGADELQVIPSTRPIYGYAGWNPEVALEEGYSYGNVLVRLKPEVLARTTWTLGDSMDQGLRPLWTREITEGSDEDIFAAAAEVLNTYGDYRDPDGELLDHFNTWSENLPYMEAQVFGGVDLDDIDAIDIDSRDIFALSIDDFRTLHGHGIEIRIDGSPWSPEEEGFSAKTETLAYNPEQARAPKGTPIGGQWIDTPSGMLHELVSRRRPVNPVKDPEDAERIRRTVSDLKDALTTYYQFGPEAVAAIAHGDAGPDTVHQDRTYGDTGFTVTIDTYWSEPGSVMIHGEVYSQFGDYAGEFQRKFTYDADAEQVVVSHDLLKIDPAFQGQGFGTDFSYASEEMYRDLGVRVIKTHAALKDGGLAWARAGYELDTSVNGEINFDHYRSGEFEEVLRRYEMSDDYDTFDVLSGLAFSRKEPDFLPGNIDLESSGYTIDDILTLRDRDGFAIGEDLLRGSSWYGVKYLEPTAVAAAGSPGAWAQSAERDALLWEFCYDRGVDYTSGTWSEEDESAWREIDDVGRIQWTSLTAGYNPEQARAPRGTPIGGQWITSPTGIMEQITPPAPLEGGYRGILDTSAGWAFPHDAVNPFRQELGGDTNCGNCVVTAEMQIRGHDVVAAVDLDAITNEEIEGAFVQSDGWTRSFSRPLSATIVRDQMEKHGPGTRFLVGGFNVENHMGHVWNAEITDSGAIMEYDFQVGLSDAGYLSSGNWRHIQYMRVDDLDIDLGYVMNGLDVSDSVRISPMAVPRDTVEAVLSLQASGLDTPVVVSPDDLPEIVEVIDGGDVEYLITDPPLWDDRATQRNKATGQITRGKPLATTGEFAFNPNQARAPRGTPIGGQWIDTPTGLKHSITGEHARDALRLRRDSSSSILHSTKFGKALRELDKQDQATIAAHTRLTLHKALGNGVTISMSEGALNAFLSEGRLRTLSESPNDPRSPGYLKKRHLYETTLMGVDPNRPANHFPIYGWGARTGESATSGYGEAEVHLKPGVKDRTTWTIGDSMDHTSGARPLWSSEVYQASEETMLASSGWAVHFGTDIVREKALSSGPGQDTNIWYVEAQVHGGVTLQDVAVVVFPWEGAVMPGTLEALTSQGVEIRYRFPENPALKYNGETYQLPRAGKTPDYLLAGS